MSLDRNYAVVTGVVIVNVILVIALGCFLQQVQRETERQARVESAIAESMNLVDLCHDAVVQVGHYSITREPIWRQSYQKDETQIPLSFQRLKCLVSYCSEHSASMVRIQTLIGRQSQLSQNALTVIDDKDHVFNTCSFRPQRLYMRIKQLEDETQVELASLRLKDAADSSRQAKVVASQFVHFLLSFLLIVNSAIVSWSVVAALRPRPLFSLNHFH